MSRASAEARAHHAKQTRELVADSPERQRAIDQAEQARSILPDPGTLTRVGETASRLLVGPYASQQDAAVTWNVEPSGRAGQIRVRGREVGTREGVKLPDSSHVVPMNAHDGLVSLFENAQIQPRCIAVSWEVEDLVRPRDLHRELPTTAIVVYSFDQGYGAGDPANEGILHQGPASES
jgi:hypothetical protein